MFNLLSSKRSIHVANISSFFLFLAKIWGVGVGGVGDCGKPMVVGSIKVQGLE